MIDDCIYILVGFSGYHESVDVAISPLLLLFFPLSMSLCFRFRSMLPKTLVPEHEAKGAERQTFRCSRRAIGNEEIHYRGVRKRPFGRFAAKIQDPRKKTRVWFNTFDSVEDASQGQD